MARKSTLPIKAAKPPNLEIPTATFAGAPPAAFLKPSASVRETPALVATKSINISPKQTINSEFFYWILLFFFKDNVLDEPTKNQLVKNLRSVQKAKEIMTLTFLLLNKIST
ncbi:hypothetical protein ACFX2J_040475 [Malus domestica]